MRVTATKLRRSWAAEWLVDCRRMRWIIHERNIFV